MTILCNVRPKTNWTLDAISSNCYHSENIYLEMQKASLCLPYKCTCIFWIVNYSFLVTAVLFPLSRIFPLFLFIHIDKMFIVLLPLQLFKENVHLKRETAEKSRLRIVYKLNSFFFFHFSAISDAQPYSAHIPPVWRML